MTKLYQYQKTGVKKIERFDGRVLLADEMGLGKTLQALTYFRRNHKTTMPAIVVCPASLKWNWAREASKHIKCRAKVLEGRTAPENTDFEVLPRLVIVNYEILPYWLDWIEALDPQLIMVDECQYIKNRSAQRTKAVKLLCRNKPHVIMMSGTPLTSRPSELFPALNILLPDVYNSFMSFAWDYCKPRFKPWGWEYKGATNLRGLHKDLKRLCMIRRRKKDVLTQLPAKTRNVVLIELPAKAKQEYLFAEKDFLKWVAKNKGKATAKKAEKAQTLVRIGYLKRLAATLKYKATLEWVDNFLEASNEKLVLFGVHTELIAQLQDRYKSICVVVDGKVTGKHRQHAVDRFQNKDNVKLFIGNLQAAGVGLTLTASSTVAFCELGWTPGEHTQAEDRIHRIGQEGAAMCHYLIAKGTIEEDLCEILQEKQTILEAALDGKGDGDHLNLFDQLTELIEKRS